MSENEAPEKEKPQPPPPREWTLMFFFGGDNELSPSMVSELKAIKDAGFQLNTSVLAHFDPNEIGAPTRIYNVNQKWKKRELKKYAPASIIGDDTASNVRSLNEDNIDPETIVAAEGEKSAILKERLKEPDTLDVREALELFLGFCREKYPAKHYILFLIGHGMIVGNDAFLPDDHVIVKRAPTIAPRREGDAEDDESRPITALSLQQLEGVVREFSDKARGEGGQFELLALHSCSMSAVEVAYQLKGTANYMMATEGVSFVGSWPYRKLLKKTFDTIEKARDDVNVLTLVSDLYFLSLHNGTDFLSAGYSSDLALCSLQEDKVKGLKAPLQELVEAMKAGLAAGNIEIDEAERDERVKELILLAHWKAQSYWQENYTDLFDFCLCLRKSCDPNDALQAPIGEACGKVMEMIGELVLHSDHYGSKYQYSHGLSVYFPWSKPVEDEANSILKRYEKYFFTSEMKDSSWLSFLKQYFKETKRETRANEEKVARATEEASGVTQQAHEAQPTEPEFKAARAYARPFGSLSRVKPSPELSGVKPSPEVGAACSCPSIKNYPDDEEIEIQGRKKCNVKAFAMSKRATTPFQSSS